MKLTEKMLLNGYQGITKGGDNISIVKNTTIFWTYRIFENGRPGCVCEIENREIITLEGDRDGEIDCKKTNENHPILFKMQSDYQKWCGIEV